MFAKEIVDAKSFEEAIEDRQGADSPRVEGATLSASGFTQPPRLLWFFVLVQPFHRFAPESHQTSGVAATAVGPRPSGKGRQTAPDLAELIVRSEKLSRGEK
jgi:hypothetical protein